MQRDLTELQRDLAWGIGWTLRVAGVFVALSIGIEGVSFLVEGASSELLPPLGQVAAFYLSGALTAGAAIGLLRPLGRHWLGAATIGFVAGLPIVLGGYLILLGFSRMSFGFFLMGAAQALVGGGLAGIMIWHDRSDIS